MPQDDQNRHVGRSNTSFSFRKISAAIWASVLAAVGLVDPIFASEPRRVEIYSRLITGIGVVATIIAAILPHIHDGVFRRNLARLAVIPKLVLNVFLTAFMAILMAVLSLFVAIISGLLSFFDKVIDIVLSPKTPVEKGAVRILLILIITAILVIISHSIEIAFVDPFPKLPTSQPMIVVTNGFGLPIPYLLLVILDSEGVFHSRKTDADGLLDMSGLPDGRYEIRKDGTLIRQGVIQNGVPQNTNPIPIPSSPTIWDQPTPASTSTPTITSTPSLTPTWTPVVVIVTPTDHVTESETWVIGSYGANGRDNPRLGADQSTVITQFYAGESIEVIGTTTGDEYQGSDKWLIVRKPGFEQILYVHASLAKPKH